MRQAAERLSSVYVALYRSISNVDLAIVVAIRNRLETGDKRSR